MLSHVSSPDELVADSLFLTSCIALYLVVTSHHIITGDHRSKKDKKLALVGGRVVKHWSVIGRQKSARFLFLSFIKFIWSWFFFSIHKYCIARNAAPFRDGCWSAGVGDFWRVVSCYLLLSLLTNDDWQVRVWIYVEWATREGRGKKRDGVMTNRRKSLFLYAARQNPRIDCVIWLPGFSSSVLNIHSTSLHIQ